MHRKTLFSRVAQWSAHAAGHPVAFIVAVLLIVIWALTGPLFHFGDTWQLVINTGTTIVTFLMIFLVQNTQNRDSVAMQLKLDELIRAVEGAHNALLDLEELTEKDLERIRQRYQKLAEQARRDVQHGMLDQGTPEIQPDDEDASKAE
jgi:low affinity Fe/Cu permease